MRRSIALLLVLVLLGAATTVALAWAFALAVPGATNNGPINSLGDYRMRNSLRELPTHQANGPSHWIVREFSRTGARDVVVTMVTSPGPTEAPFEELLPDFERMRLGMESRESSPTWKGSNYFVTHARGWPLVAMMSEWDWFGQTNWPRPPVTAGITFGDPPGAGLWPFGIIQLRALPLRPVWPGFAIDTLLFAAIWSLAILPFHLRRVLRRRRNCCVHCGFPAGQGPICSECGRSHA